MNSYIYKPEIPEVFRCRVPLPNTAQAYVVNGVLREEDTFESKMILKKKDLEGFELTVEKGSQIERNFQIISFRDATNTTDLNYSTSFLFQERSVSNILLCTHTLSMDEFKTEENVNIEVEDGAIANIVIMQNEHNRSNHIMKLNINLSKNSTFKLTLVTLHGALIKNELDVKMTKEGGTCELNGLYLVDGVQQIHTTVNMHHLVPRCYSRQLFKGILDNESKAFFVGKIYVSKDAQKTEAYQANHNLLLSRKSKAYAQPQLEIYADDVKCSHGATSGRLDDDAMFYMRSRGISMQEAKVLQQLAFIYDVLEKISNESLRQRLQDLVESRLRGEFSHCNNCSMNCC